jgi:hypothetical protein
MYTCILMSCIYTYEFGDNVFFFVFLVSRVTCSIFQLQDKTEYNKGVH